jgi:hypothetical protein
MSQCRVPNERRRIVVSVLPAVFSMCVKAYIRFARQQQDLWRL